MSFLVAVYVNEGIVLASDRRSTYTRTENINGLAVQKIGIHVTNSTDKTFICPNGAGISTCGDASLLGKPITGFIQDMIHCKIKEETSVKEIPQIIIDYFSSFAMIPNVNFLVAGYATDEDSTQNQKLYKVVLNSGRKTIEEINTASQGALWDGEVTTFSRIMQDVAILQNGSYVDLPHEEILFGYFTLQDAVDFARFAVETTINTMRFKNVVETVGGAVDILVITPKEVKWLQKAELH